MSHSSQAHGAHDCLPDRLQDRHVSYFWSGDAIRSRSVSSVLLSGTVNVPAPPARLLADWERETSLRLVLEPGEVEALSLARACARWPDYRLCVQAASSWTATLGLPAAFRASCDIALMACRGARYHHDAELYGDFAFCNLFLSEDKGLDLHFPNLKLLIPLKRGTAVIFDTAQLHAVIPRGKSDFHVTDFPATLDCSQVFLTWELPLANANLTELMQMRS